MATIDPAGFARFAPGAVPGTLAALQAAATAHGINETLTLAHWLGQMHVESGGFTRMTENLNYSVQALESLFNRSRISLADCARFGRTPSQPANQEMLANLLYGGDFGLRELGNNQDGDGWRYRGGGFKQITGRANYRSAGHEADPDTLRTDVAASAEAAADFFVRKGCLVPARADNVAAVTRIINGGEIGLPDRITQTGLAKGIVR